MSTSPKLFIHSQNSFFKKKPSRILAQPRKRKKSLLSVQKKIKMKTINPQKTSTSHKRGRSRRHEAPSCIWSVCADNEARQKVGYHIDIQRVAHQRTALSWRQMSGEGEAGGEAMQIQQLPWCEKPEGDDDSDPKVGGGASDPSASQKADRTPDVLDQRSFTYKPHTGFPRGTLRGPHILPGGWVNVTYSLKKTGKKRNASKIF